MNRRRVFLFGVCLLLVVGGGLVYRHMSRSGPAPLPKPPGPRRIQPLPARSHVSVRDWGSNGEWMLLSLRYGSVAIPAGKEVKLDINIASFKGTRQRPLSLWDKIRSKLRMEVTPVTMTTLPYFDECGPDDFQAIVLSSDRSRIVYSGGAAYVSRTYGKEREVDLSSLGRFRSLRELDLGGVYVTDEGLAELKELTSLRSLNLGDTRITDTGLIHLAALPSLRKLHLAHTKIGNAKLGRLRKLTEIEALWLDNTEVGDAGMRHVAKLRSLRELHLDGTAVTDKGIGRLRKLTALRALYLARTKVTDKGLGHIAQLGSLRELSLNDTGVSDAGLVHLKKMSGLKRLRLAGTKTSKRGRTEIKESLPECHVTW